jgi:hypothetical protein
VSFAVLVLLACFRSSPALELLTVQCAGHVLLLSMLCKCLTFQLSTFSTAWHARMEQQVDSSIA